MTSLTAIPLVSKLSKSVIRILGCNPGPMTLQGTNTYLVGTGLRRALIDSGDAETGATYASLLTDVLRKENATIEHLIITHWHHDHIGGIDSVQQILSNRLPKENPAVVWKIPCAANDLVGTNAEKQSDWRPLKDEQNIEIEGANLRVKHTPGHTTDHAVLFLEDEKTLFSGDCILGEGTTVFEDLHDYMTSLENILKMDPKVIYPGHGPVIDDPIPKIKYYIQHRRKREEEILRVLESRTGNGPVSEMDIVQIIYKDTPENLWVAAASNVAHHLEKLLKQQKVVGRAGSWSIAS